MKYNTQMIKQVPGIYYIKQKHSQRIYIGSSINMYKRIVLHSHELRYNKHPNRRLQNNYNKYGFDILECGVMEYCPEEELLIKEQYYYNLYKVNTFNTREIVTSNIGILKPMSEETREKLRNPSDETRNRMSISHLGYIMPEEQKEKIRVGNLGKTSYNVEAATKVKFKAVVQLDINGEVVMKWESVKQCMKELNISQPTMYKLLQGVEMKRKCKNMIIRYEQQVGI